jgi:hypothetical protein
MKKHLYLLLLLFAPLLAVGQNNWIKLADNVSEVITGRNPIDQLNLVYIVEASSGNIHELKGNNQLVKIGGPAKKFVIAGGQLYGLSVEGKSIHSYKGKPNQWEKVGNEAGTIIGGEYQLMATNPNSGDLYLYNNKPFSWTKIGAAGKQFVAAAFNKIYGISTEGNGIYAFQKAEDWQRIGSASKKLYAAGDKLLSVDPKTGDLMEYSGQAFKWQKIGGAAKMFAIGDVNHIYGLSPKGDGIYRYNGQANQWSRIGDAAKAIYAVGNELYAINNNNQLMKYVGVDHVATAEYLIIAANNDLVKSLKNFADWKTKRGLKTVIITQDEIYLQQKGRDKAEQIRAFLVHLHKNYKRLRYLMLVGDIDQLPTRIFYADDGAKYRAYAADFYFADLHTENFDLDGDNKWGEFDDDKFDWKHDIVVGRLPFNDAITVKRICQNIQSFEQDNKDWKKSALMVNPFLDEHTDVGVMADYTERYVFSKNGWKVKHLNVNMEKSTSKYLTKSNVYPLSAKTYMESIAPKSHSLVIVSGHGNPTSLASHYVKTEGGLNSFYYSHHHEMKSIDELSAIVMLNGCSTTPPIADDSGLDQEKSLWTTVGKPNVVREHTGKAYLRSGAVSVIGASAGGDYHSGWKTPENTGSSTLAYFFIEELVSRGELLGDAFFKAQKRYADKHGLQRGIRVMYLLGDPTLNINK